MSNDPRQVNATSIVRVSQIIVIAMFTGVLTFLVIAMVVRKPVAAAPFVVTSMAGLFAAGALVARTVVLANVARKARRDLLQGALAAPGSPVATLPAGLDRNVQCLLPAFQMRTIVGSALCEGPAFFAIVAYIAEGNLWSIYLTVFLAACLLLNLPTSSRVLRWVEQQQELMEQERMRTS